MVDMVGMVGMVERLTWASVAALALAGCAKQSDRASAAAPTEARELGSKRAAADPLGELAQLEGRMRALGLEPAASKRVPVEDELQQDALEAEPTPERELPGHEPRANERVDEGGRSHEETASPPPTEAPSEPTTTMPMPAGDCEGDNRCTSICELSEAICQLEIQICAMAKDHEGDPIYTDACERAVEDCELSGDACNECTP